MEETLPMFSFEEPEGDTPQMLQEQTGAGAVDVPGQDRIEDHAGIGEGQEQDGTETPVDLRARVKCAGPGGCGHRRAGRERRDGGRFTRVPASEGLLN